jgi:hypothetical protein
MENCIITEYVEERNIEYQDKCIHKKASKFFTLIIAQESNCIKCCKKHVSQYSLNTCICMEHVHVHGRVSDLYILSKEMHVHAYAFIRSQVYLLVLGSKIVSINPSDAIRHLSALLLRKQLTGIKRGKKWKILP